jgi:DDE domain
MRNLLKKYGFVPDKLVTDELRSYAAAAHDLGIAKRHERGRWRNNRAENSHQPTRRRERDLRVAVERGLWADNPARGVRKAPVRKVERFLSEAEIAQLAEGLDGMRSTVSLPTK